MQASFLLTVVFGFLVIKGELRRPMPSALPVRALCPMPDAAVHALLFVLTCVCLLAAQAAFNKCHSRVRHFGGVFAIAVVFMACVCVLPCVRACGG